MLDEKEKQDFINLIKEKNIAGSWWDDDDCVKTPNLAYFIPTGRIFGDKFECHAYTKDDIYIDTDKCEFKNGFADHFGTCWVYYYGNVLKPEVENEDCKHENKKEIKMIFTSYWLCEDCGKDFDLP